MGWGMPNDVDNPLVPLKQTVELAVTGKESEASDSGQISHVNNTSGSAFMSFPFASVPNSHWENTQGMHQSCTQDPRIVNNMPGLVTSQNAHSEHSFIDLKGNLRNQYTKLSGLDHPQVNMTFVPNPNTIPGGYYKNHTHVGEGKTVDVNRSQITESSLYSGCNQSMVQGTRDTFVNNNARTGAWYPGKIDGSFLTLGIGGDVECRTKHKFSSREIASELEENCNFPVAQATTNFPTPSHNFTGCSTFQSNPPVFPGSMYNNLGSFSSHAFQSSHMPEAFKQYDFFESSGRSLGTASKSPGTYLENGAYNPYQGVPAPALLPFSNTNDPTIHPGFSHFSNLASESAKLTGTTFQPTLDQPQNYHARSVRDASSSFGSNSMSVMANPVTQDYLGKLIPAVHGSMTQAVGSGSSMSVQSIGNMPSTPGVNSATPLGSATFPGKILPQIAEATAPKPVTIGPFPRRLGVQPDGGPQSVNQGMDPRVMGVRTRGGVKQPRHIQLTKNLHGSPSGTGNPQDTLPHQFNVQAPLFSSGPAPFNAKADQPSQMSNPTDQPSLKRGAVDPRPVAPWGRRRKLTHVSTALNSIRQQGTAATVLPPVPSETPRIRWQGFDERPRPLGHKCLLCKRDLSFTAEGPVSLPSMPPVAVLPCGHTFHDHCLERITPRDQIKDPPCIPCAIGEPS